MNTDLHPELLRIAELIGQSTRAAILDALLGGEWLPASELARRGGVSPSTASAHLSRLVDGGLIERRSRGRRVEYALASPEVAATLETLARLPGYDRATPDERTNRRRALRFARTCYDHLAGSLGVAITERLVVRKLIAPDGRDVTAEGSLWLRELGIDIEALKARRRTLSRFCLDWSERRDHLAGAMGAAIAATMFERGWLARLPDTRAVRLTLRGRKGLYRALDLEVEPWYRS